MMALLEIEDLHVEFPTQAGVMHAVDGVSLALDEGGFRGAEWDPAHDVEYTFYGLGTLGLLTKLL